MSLWDFVAAASIATNINDSNSKSAKILKKINSASLNILNGDKVDYVGCGGRTANTFGAITAINCDMLLIFGDLFRDSLRGNVGKLGEGFLQAWGTSLYFLFGFSSVNVMNIGNKIELQYMNDNAHNYTFRRGGSPMAVFYASIDSKRIIKLRIVLVLFVLAIYGFYLIYNFAGVFGKGIMSPVGDSGYIKTQQGKVDSKDKEIAALEASEAQQKKEQQQRADAGYVLSPAEQEAQDAELQDTEDQLAEVEHQKALLESTLKTAEKQKAWLIYGNVILESKGFFLMHYLEILNFAGPKIVEMNKEIVDENLRRPSVTSFLASSVALTASVSERTNSVVVDEVLELSDDLLQESVREIADADMIQSDRYSSRSVWDDGEVGLVPRAKHSAKSAALIAKKVFADIDELSQVAESV